MRFAHNLTTIAHNLPALLLLFAMRSKGKEQGGLVVSNIFQTPSSYKATIIPSIRQISPILQVLPLDR
jgi:hypothetical protein